MIHTKQKQFCAESSNRTKLAACACCPSIRPSYLIAKFVREKPVSEAQKACIYTQTTSTRHIAVLINQQRERPMAGTAADASPVCKDPEAVVEDDAPEVADPDDEPPAELAPEAVGGELAVPVAPDVTAASAEAEAPELVCPPPLPPAVLVGAETAPLVVGADASSQTVLPTPPPWIASDGDGGFALVIVVSSVTCVVAAAASDNADVGKTVRKLEVGLTSTQFRS